VYVDDLLECVNSMGCKFFGLTIGALMYADDIVFLSNSVYQLQLMLNVCESQLAQLDLRINCQKSACMRIGPSFNSKCIALLSINGEIKWVKETKYLGLVIKSGKFFCCDRSHNKSKFYRSANAILGKICQIGDKMVAMHLLSSISVPVLTYGIDALSLSNSDVRSLEHSWEKSLFKVFGTFNMQIVHNCQFFGGLLPLGHIYFLRKTKFLLSLRQMKNKLISFVYSKTGSAELQEIAHKYCINDTVTFVEGFHRIIHSCFKQSLNV
jgi:hypothetical protein